MKRQVIQLPQQQDESALKVELMIGQTLEVDCSHHHLTNQELESKPRKAGAMITMSLRS